MDATSRSSGKTGFRRARAGRALAGLGLAAALLAASGCGGYKHDYSVQAPDGKVYRNQTNVRWFPWVKSSSKTTVTPAPGS